MNGIRKAYVCFLKGTAIPCVKENWETLGMRLTRKVITCHIMGTLRKTLKSYT